MGVPEQGFDGRTFGKYLRNVRTSRNLSLDTVEEMTHGYPEPVTKSHLSRIENGRAAPSFARMYALSQIYGVPISALAERFEIDLHRGMHHSIGQSGSPDALIKEIVALLESGEMIRGLVLCTTVLDEMRARDPQEPAKTEIMISLRFHRIVFLSRLERFETAKIESEQLLADLGEDADEIWRFKILRCFVQCCYRLGRYSIAKMGMDTLGQQLDKLPLSLKAHFVNLRASISNKTGDLKSASADYLEASRMFEELADHHSSCTATLNLAQTYMDMGKRNEPIKLLRRSISTCEKYGFQRLHSLALSHLCLVCYENDEPDSAEAHAMRSNAIARPREFFSIVFRNCYYLRAIALARGDSRGVRSHERSLKALLNRADQEMSVLQSFRCEIEGESR